MGAAAALEPLPLILASRTGWGPAEVGALPVRRALAYLRLLNP